MALARDNYRLARSVYSSATLGLILGILSILLSLYSVRRPELTRQVLSVVLYFTTPVERALTTAGDGISNFFGSYVFLISTKAKNQELLAQVERLQTRNAELEEIASENARLRGLVSMSEVVQSHAIAARVVGYETTNWRRTLTVSAGSRSGIKVGSAVIGARGVVGLVTSVSAFASHIQLLTDPASSVDGIGHQGRARGVVDGEGGQYLRWRFVSTSEDIKEGELVVTTGLDGIFPKGVTIGVVREVEAISDDPATSDAASTKLFQSIVITPSESLDHLEEVLISVSEADIGTSSSTAQNSLTGKTIGRDVDKSVDKTTDKNRGKTAKLSSTQTLSSPSSKGT